MLRRLSKVIAMAAGGEPDQLDRAAGQRAGDVAANLENAILVELVEGVVARGLANGSRPYCPGAI